MSGILDSYRLILAEIRAGLDHARSVQSGTLWLLAVALALHGTLTFLAFGGRAPVWSPPLPAPLTLVAAGRYGRNRSAWSRLTRLNSFYQRGIARLENQFAGHGFTGEEFRTADHAYERDLNLFGTGSLFELLCTTRTQIGRARLAAYLTECPATDEAKARQEAVRELAGQSRLREDIALLGRFEFRESSTSTFSGWLNASASAGTVPRLLRVLTLATSVLSIGLFLWTYIAMPLTIASWLIAAPWLAGLLLIHAGVWLAYREPAQAPLEAGKRLGLEIGVLRGGITLLQHLTFESGKLREIQSRLARVDAARKLRQLEWMTSALDACDNPFFALFAQVLVVRIQLWFAMADWQSSHGELLRGWIDAWAEFEALSALAGYACENPANQFPEFVDGETRFDGLEIGHPLIPEAVCVRNDITLGPDYRLLVISGSNMAGKSTLLRALGLNVVLAGAGAPVRAASLRISDLSLCASIGVIDSLREGKSRFLAEIAKLRLMIDVAQRRPTMYLIDEILSGTNSRDRRIAAEAVVSTLAAAGAIGALSTHDLALTQLAELPGLSGINLHMGSRDQSDPLDFDYRLKPGVIRESNALAIARMVGVPVVSSAG